MCQRLVRHGSLHHPNGQLVGDNHDIPAVDRIHRIAHRGQHSLGDVAIRLAPRRAKRVHQELPQIGTGQKCPTTAQVQSAEFVPRFDDTIIDNRGQPRGFLPRLCRFPRALQRAHDDR